MSRQPRNAHIGGPVLALSSLCALAMADAQPPPLHYLINASSSTLFLVLQETRTDAQAPDLSRDLRFASWSSWFPFHFAFSFCWKKMILLSKYVVCLHVSLFSSGWSCFSCLPVVLNFSCAAVFSAAFPDFLLSGFDSRGWFDCGPVVVNSRPVRGAV
jgi:hypothetical protein